MAKLIRHTTNETKAPWKQSLALFVIALMRQKYILFIKFWLEAYTIAIIIVGKKSMSSLMRGLHKRNYNCVCTHRTFEQNESAFKTNMVHLHTHTNTQTERKKNTHTQYKQTGKLLFAWRTVTTYTMNLHIFFIFDLDRRRISVKYTLSNYFAPYTLHKPV